MNSIDLQEVKRLRNYGYTVNEITEHLWSIGVDVYASEVWEACEGIDATISMEEWFEL